MALEMDVKNGTEPTVVAKLLMPLRSPEAAHGAEVEDMVGLLQRLFAYMPTERPSAREAGEWGGGGVRESECVDGSAGVHDMVQDMAALRAALVAQPIESRIYNAESVEYDVFLGYRVKTDSALANELYDKSFVVSAQHPDWHFSQVQSILHTYLPYALYHVLIGYTPIYTIYRDPRSSHTSTASV
jgi:hypothetical protein